MVCLHESLRIPRLQEEGCQDPRPGSAPQVADPPHVQRPGSLDAELLEGPCERSLVDQALHDRARGHRSDERIRNPPSFIRADTATAQSSSHGMRTARLEWRSRQEGPDGIRRPVHRPSVDEGLHTPRARRLDVPARCDEIRREVVCSESPEDAQSGHAPDPNT